MFAVCAFFELDYLSRRNGCRDNGLNHPFSQTQLVEMVT